MARQRDSEGIVRDAFRILPCHTSTTHIHRHTRPPASTLLRSSCWDR